MCVSAGLTVYKMATATDNDDERWYKLRAIVWVSLANCAAPSSNLTPHLDTKPYFAHPTRLVLSWLPHGLLYSACRGQPVEGGAPCNSVICNVFRGAPSVFRCWIG